MFFKKSTWNFALNSYGISVWGFFPEIFVQGVFAGVFCLGGLCPITKVVLAANIVKAAIMIGLNFKIKNR